MKKKTLSILTILMLCLAMLTACDPIYPTGNIKIAKQDTLSKGSCTEIDITYPNTGGSIVLGWKNQHVEIIEGEDIVSASGLTITAISTGKALLKISATTLISDDAVAAGYKERVYSTEIEIKVE